MQTPSSDENSVYLSVRPSVYPSVSQTRQLWQKDLSRFLYHTKDHSLIFREEEEWLVGVAPSTPDILGQPAPVRAKSPILSR